MLLFILTVLSVIIIGSVVVFFLFRKFRNIDSTAQETKKEVTNTKKEVTNTKKEIIAAAQGASKFFEDVIVPGVEEINTSINNEFTYVNDEFNNVGGKFKYVDGKLVESENNYKRLTLVDNEINSKLTSTSQEIIDTRNDIISSAEAAGQFFIETVLPVAQEFKAGYDNKFFGVEDKFNKFGNKFVDVENNYKRLTLADNEINSKLTSTSQEIIDTRNDIISSAEAAGQFFIETVLPVAQEFKAGYDNKFVGVENNLNNIKYNQLQYNNEFQNINNKFQNNSNSITTQELTTNNLKSKDITATGNLIGNRIVANNGLDVTGIFNSGTLNISGVITANSDVNIKGKLNAINLNTSGTLTSSGVLNTENLNTNGTLTTNGVFNANGLVTIRDKICLGTSCLTPIQLEKMMKDSGF